MAWTIEFGESARQELAKLDKSTARRITTFLRERLASLDDPRTLGQALQGKHLGSLWRYRVGGYRLIYRIQDDRLVVVLVVTIGHRREVCRDR